MRRILKRAALISGTLTLLALASVLTTAVNMENRIPGGARSLRVVDENGCPIEGAQIVGEGGSLGPFAMGPASRFRSDRDGKVTLMVRESYVLTSRRALLFWTIPITWGADEAPESGLRIRARGFRDERLSTSKALYHKHPVTIILRRDPCSRQSTPPTLTSPSTMPGAA